MANMLLYFTSFQIKPWRLLNYIKIWCNPKISQIQWEYELYLRVVFTAVLVNRTISFVVSLDKVNMPRLIDR